MDKVKKGLDSAVDGAKVAGGMAIIKKNIEQSKLKKSKKIKEMGEVVYNNKELFVENELLTQSLTELENIDEELEKLENDLKEESSKF
ncbi:hypothetical protein QUF55_07200 [Clostridiaceae bacterium HSG29]|nr:hypothetical protein [Clostridiaceae bacterium HSG29]